MLLDSMLERIKAEKTVNVYEFLTGLRRRRVLMVQTLVCSHLLHLLSSLFPVEKCIQSACLLIQLGHLSFYFSCIVSVIEHLDNMSLCV